METKLVVKPLFKFTIIFCVIIFCGSLLIGGGLLLLDGGLLSFAICFVIGCFVDFLLVLAFLYDSYEVFYFTENDLIHTKNLTRTRYSYADLKYVCLVLRQVGRIKMHKEIEGKQVAEYDFIFCKKPIATDYMDDSCSFSDTHYLFGLLVNDETIKIIEKVFFGKLFLLKKLREKNSTDYDKVKSISNEKINVTEI